MNKNYDLTWDLKRLGTKVLFNKTINYDWSASTQKKTYTLPAYYKDLDYIIVEVSATWTNLDNVTEYDGPMKATWSLQADFRSPSIAIPDGTDSTGLYYAINDRPTLYDAGNPSASGTYPLDPSLPWKDVSYSAAGKSIAGSFRAIIANPYKNSTKDNYLHGSLSLGAWVIGTQTGGGETHSPIWYDIDGNKLTIKAYVPYQNSLSLSIKMVGHGRLDI